jgi:cytochrome c553
MIRWRYELVLCLSLVLLLSAPAAAADAGENQPALRDLVESDWSLQEKRRGLTADDPVAIRQALDRGQRLMEDLSLPAHPLRYGPEALQLAECRRRAEQLATLDRHDRLALYQQIRWLIRGIALKNPLFAERPIVLLKRRRFVCQMLHEYLGYYYDYGDIAGGGVSVLERPGHALATRDLTAARLPRGNYTTLALSFDARTIYFAYAPRAEGKPDYDSPERRCFHVFAVDVEGQNLRQLTDGQYDDFDPCPLPDGDVAFMSTRRGGFGRCHGSWEPLPCYTLHRMRADGSHVQTLSYHETNEWHPSVLADGRIVYTRWDYVDRSAANFHGLWSSNPDGTKPTALFGNYTRRINACYQPRSIPGSGRIVFVAGAHHAAVGGSLVVFDPAAAGLDAGTGEDRFDALEVLTPEVCFPEAPGWPGSFFHSPWPLSENYFLVAFSFEPLPGMGPRVNKDAETGIYLFDRFGNMELLYRQPGLSSMYPIPLAPRPVPPVVASTRDPLLGDQAELVLTDVRLSHLALPASRPIRQLRVFQVLPKSHTHVANQPRLGYANAESARILLGTVPVESDGSAYLRVPARKPIYFQAVDANGRAVQGMRSVTYLQPGQRQGCVGCHEKHGTSPPSRPTLALQRPPSVIEPGPDGSQPWSFPRLVQPILTARCVRCHDGTQGEGQVAPNLSAAVAGPFTQSYESLKPLVRWYEWGQGIGGDVTRPGHMPADESPLTKILDDPHHAGQVELTDLERRAIYLWLDGNASFYGTYVEAAQLAQKRGQRVPLPELQ